MRPFISTSDLGAYLRQDFSSSELAVMAADAACQSVRDYLQQQVNYEDADGVALDGTGSNVVLLPELPVVEVTEVSLMDNEGDIETLTADEDWVLGSAGDLWRRGIWPVGISNVLVVYSHGWDIDPAESGQGSGEESAENVPSSIRMVALQIASRVYSAGAVSVGGLTSESMGSYSYSLGGASDAGAAIAVTGSEMLVLDRYRRRRILSPAAMPGVVVPVFP